jgi:putative photosynthetic complex assembly protein
MTAVPSHAQAPAEDLPRAPLVAAGLLIAVALLAAGVSRIVGTPTDRPEGAALASRDLRFADQADGSVIVLDARSGESVERLAPGSNGFLRASLRSLARRRLFEGEASRSFHLTAWSDGRLTLDDPATGGLIDLEAFGPTNEAVFARFLQFGSTPR